MLQGMAELTEMTDNCIRFVPYTDQPAWVRIVDGGGCSSYHGQHQENGYQELSMNRKSCIGKDIIKHEFLHALGFIHEQSRPDRDAYIKILYENLVPDSSHNYDKVNKYSAVDLNIPYDISFYMHYNNQGFSINGLPTMIPVKDESISLRFTMGSPGGFNIKDVPRIKKQLGCPA
ncbi:hypothetical protein I4U23_005495 [Adineta vaga]|nr:hypothetical protein I4U23_005495 [Adineta vaga]